MTAGLAGGLKVTASEEQSVQLVTMVMPRVKQPLLQQRVRRGLQRQTRGAGQNERICTCIMHLYPSQEKISPEMRLRLRMNPKVPALQRADLICSPGWRSLKGSIRGYTEAINDQRKCKNGRRGQSRKRYGAAPGGLSGVMDQQTRAQIQSQRLKASEKA